jgi:hypothetical protein
VVFPGWGDPGCPVPGFHVATAETNPLRLLAPSINRPAQPRD